ncbi:bacteriocin [Streptococcus pyogenes]|nr:BlpM-like bacteriocin [Streptococcus pyogenes]VGQ33132.1 BlpM-like bacteriocin [Streptococcus pyogenes]VGQ47529.1 BlpM-like bacteriocin [Streptococcus pyogenes]VGQ52400.1 BlpM-like bacteriocin [Streptococcus pyogenes]VGQ82929.1 BlpM-like bacteriocin [Streptococcus pyogenes]
MMNTKTMEQFEVMNSEMLAGVEGGKNNWQTNVWEGGSSAVAGWGLCINLCSEWCWGTVNGSLWLSWS